MLNSVGLQGRGGAWLDETAGAARRGPPSCQHLGRTVEEFESGLDAAGAAVAAVEVNVSCPNSMTARACSPITSATAEALDAAAGAAWRVAKLSPTTPDLLEVARAASTPAPRR